MKCIVRIAYVGKSYSSNRETDISISRITAGKVGKGNRVQETPWQVVY